MDAMVMSKDNEIFDNLVSRDGRADKPGGCNTVPAPGQRGEHADRQGLDNDGKPEGDHGKEPFLEPDAGEADEDPDECGNSCTDKDRDEAGRCRSLPQ